MPTFIYIISTHCSYGNHSMLKVCLNLHQSINQSIITMCIVKGVIEDHHHLCSSPQLYGAFYHLSARPFVFTLCTCTVLVQCRNAVLTCSRMFSLIDPSEGILNWILVHLRPWCKFFGQQLYSGVGQNNDLTDLATKSGEVCCWEGDLPKPSAEV